MAQNMRRARLRPYADDLDELEDTLPVRVKEAVDAAAARGVDIRALARHAKVSHSWIYDVMNGDVKSPGMDKLNRLAAALGVTITYLLDGKERDELVVENLPQLLAWENAQHQQHRRHIERAIQAEAQRLLEERWDAYLMERLALLRQQEPALAEALGQAEQQAQADAEKAHEHQVVSDVLDKLTVRAVHQDEQARSRRERAAGRAAG